MLRTAVTPLNKDLHILIPDSYVGKNLELIIYAIDEPITVQPEAPGSMSKFKGILTEQEATSLQEYVKKFREEWNSSI